MTVSNQKYVNLPKKPNQMCFFSKKFDQVLENLTLESPLHIHASTSIKKKLT